ncbi:MAG: peptide/nickel transport system substrate-binding protein [Solirubrobacteraceae bacterium]|nr:peptide/nickel transport system substrate-binding protein [Solirubrobacteraceae bacterium]
MYKPGILVGRGLAVLTAVAALSACGSSSSTSSSSTKSSTAGTSTGGSAGTVTVAEGTAPDYLDPGLGYTTQAANGDWLAYTGLYTYAHQTGVGGGAVIPGLATALPQISADGRTYTMTLRSGLTYSNGTPVKASDFAYSIQRSIKLNWGGKSFYTTNIVGADAFDKGTAKTISGIKTDDATGKITVTLLGAYGAFPNVLAFPSSGLVPTGTPISNLTNHPPPGVGPYIIKNVVPNQSFSVVRNPNWKPLPGIAAGHVDVNVKITSNTNTEAEMVLNGTADAFDWGDTVPPALVSQIKAKAAGRYNEEPSVSTFYFFLNTKVKPFNSLAARQAVQYAVDRQAIVRLSSGTIEPGCYFLPPGMIGHPTAPCPYGDTPNLAKAKALITQAGLAGTPVTVWGQMRSPRREYVDYYTSVLNQIGFKATEKILADAQFFPTIGNLKLNPQTGFADWNQDFPNPSDFYLLLDAKSIQQTNNQNFSQVNDPKVQSELAALNKVPATQLQSVAARWSTLDEYVAKQAYFNVYGSQTHPKFLSDRIDYASAVFHPVYGNDWSSWQLK